jgi:hypothetical protein
VKIKKVWLLPPDRKKNVQILFMVDEMLLESEQEKVSIARFRSEAVIREVGTSDVGLLRDHLIIQIPNLGKRVLLVQEKTRMQKERYSLLTLQLFDILFENKPGDVKIDESTVAKFNIDVTDYRCCKGMIAGMPSITFFSKDWQRLLAVVCIRHEVIDCLLAIIREHATSTATIREQSDTNGMRFVIPTKGSQLQKETDELLEQAEGLIIQVETLSQALGALFEYYPYLKNLDSQQSIDPVLYISGIRAK